MLSLLGIGSYHPVNGARVNDAAPEFSLPDHLGRQVSLKDLLGPRPLVLAFYPRANSPVCTRQMCSLRDHDEELKKRARVVGISYSDTRSMKRFIDKQGLKIDMLSDSRKTVARLYGAYGWWAPARVTFIIDPSGIIRAVIDRVQSGSHAEQVLKALDAAGL